MHEVNTCSCHLQDFIHLPRFFFGGRLKDIDMYNGHITPYEGSNIANQVSRKKGVCGRKLEGSHSLFYCYLILEKINHLYLIGMFIIYQINKVPTFYKP